jgi:hypothetical protein
VLFFVTTDPVVITVMSPNQWEEHLAENTSMPAREEVKAMLKRWEDDPDAWFRDYQAIRQKIWDYERRKYLLWWPIYR